MALSANREVDRYVDQELRSYQVATGAHVYKGGFVGLNASGYVRALAAGDRCAGLAYEEADNTSGLNGDVAVRCSLTVTSGTRCLGRPSWTSGERCTRRATTR